MEWIQRVAKISVEKNSKGESVTPDICLVELGGVLCTHLFDPADSYCLAASFSASLPRSLSCSLADPLHHSLTRCVTGSLAVSLAHSLAHRLAGSPTRWHTHWLAHRLAVSGTVGDIESAVFLEALRQLQRTVGRDNFAQLHVSLVPVMEGEQKTKPVQHGVKELRSIGAASCCVAVALCYY